MASTSSVENANGGRCEGLTPQEFQSQFEFLQGIEAEAETGRIDINADGYPFRKTTSRTMKHERRKYEVNTEREINVIATPSMNYLLLVWQQETSADSIWFKTHGRHSLKIGSVVEMKNILEELVGFHCVTGVYPEVGSSEGNTLFTVAVAAERLTSAARLQNGVLWQYTDPAQLGTVTHQFELTPFKQEKYHVIWSAVIPTKPSPSALAAILSSSRSNNSHQMIPAIKQERELEQSAEAPKHSVSPATLQMIMKGTHSAVQGPAAAEVKTDGPGVIFAGFKPTSGNNGPTESLISSLAALQTRDDSVMQSNSIQQNSAMAPFEEVEVEEFVQLRTIISDSESDDDPIADTLDTVPFIAEEFGLASLECPQGIIQSIILSFSCHLSDRLMEIGRVVRFVLHDDPDGMKFVQNFKSKLSEGIEQALMQKGDAVCLIPQKMYGVLRQALQNLEVSYTCLGGVLLQILECLDKTYREQQFHLKRLRLESGPANPYEHMMESIRPELSYPLSVGMPSAAVIEPQMPHLASIIDQPEISTLTDPQLKSLFRNAPYLMKNECSNPKFLNKMRDYLGQRASGPLRGYQKYSVDRFLSGGNYIFVAPTGAGKTRIFVECSRKLLQSNRAATIVVTCPSVALATQQACVYVVEGFLKEGYWVNTFSSDNQLTPQAWRHLASTHNVMVLTPQLLLNIMSFYKDVDNYSIFDEIDLLIMDECHHVRKEHAYNKIMTAYGATARCKTQVLGFTASPARTPDLEEGAENLNLLLDQMKARCIVLDDTNEEVQKHVPAAKEETAYCDEREEDIQYARTIGEFMYNSCLRYLCPLVGKVRGVMRLTDQSLADMVMGLMSSTFENWSKITTEKLQENEALPQAECADLISSIELLRACNNSLDLVNDAGFESSLKVLAQRILEIGTVVASAATGSPKMMFTQLLAGLYCSGMIQSIAPVLQAYQMNPFPMEYSKFPRFIQLVQFLERFKDQDELHGMVFVKTRDGVYHLAKMLRLMPALKNTFIFEFTGHGQGNKKKTTPIASAIETLKGMSGSKQQEVLDRFCRPGRHVLCATSAAEEGINVTNCQFVVRYSVTYTGIQRVQSRGRSRVEGGIFFNIIQRNSKEAKFLEKSQQEEVNMNTILRNSERVEHI